MNLLNVPEKCLIEFLMMCDELVERSCNQSAIHLLRNSSEQSVLIYNSCVNTTCFDVASYNLLFSMHDPMLEFQSLSIDWLGPQFVRDVIVSVLKQCKLLKEGIVRDS